jgi:hypothetical protein
VVVDVVTKLTVAVPAPPVTAAGLTEHVGMLVGLEIAVVTAHISVTLDVKLFTGVTVIVAVLPEVRPAPKVIGPLLVSPKPGIPCTVTFTAVDPVTFPVAASAPDTVAVYDPGVVDAVVVTVSVVDCAPVPVISTVGPTLHVAGLLAATGVTAQVTLTFPVNPYDGVTVIVAVSPVVAPATKLSAPLLVSAIAGGGGAVTVTVTVVLAVIRPVAASLPVTVAV